MKIHFFIILLLSTYVGCAQTVVEKTIVANKIEFVEINAINCFDIALETTDENQAYIVAKIEGEYQNDLVLEVNEMGSTLHIGAGFQPIFKNPNDKLSAHKVVSIALQIRLPRGKRVVLNGRSCNVNVKGEYSNVDVSLNDGQCVLQHVSENATVRTQSGDISIIGGTATIDAESKYGKISKNTIPKGDNRYVVKTVTGDIRFSRTK